ncbi:MAG: tyrosine-type recombinase/integrase [Limnohabitans sp.]
MSKANNKLTDTKIKTLKTKGKHFDGDGLYLEVTSIGSKLWRLKYRFAGTEKLLSLGTYPSVTLATAREFKDEARTQIATGIDPSSVKKAQKAKIALDASQTLKACAEAWIDHMSPKWGMGTKLAVISSFKRDVYPLIGSRSMSTILAKDIIKAAKLVEARGATDQSARLLQRLKSFTRWATVNQILESNPSGDIKPDDVLKKRVVVNRPSLHKDQLRDFMVRLEDYQGDAVVAAGLRFLALTALRPGEVRHLQWNDIDFKEKTLTIPASRMKMGRTHRVPLSTQALNVLEQIKPLNGHRTLVFSSIRKPGFPMSENTLNLGLQRMGFQATSHGMRSTFSTIANESLNFKPEVIEAALSHVKGDKVASAYNRTDYLKERIKLMQWWANFLDSSARIIKSKTG